MMYSLNEVSLLPSMHPVNINHRSEVNPFDENGKLPIFVSPMTCIIDDDNYQEFKNSKFIPIVPRNIMPNYITPEDWISCSLQDFEEVFMKYDLDELHILIDIANGHMKRLYEVVKEAKSKYPDLKLMIGNIAHPEMYTECFLAGADYVRVGIGGGNACSTSVKTGIHASHEYMLRGIRKIRTVINSDKAPKVVIDGGIDTYDKAIKCLALGADYVMMGKMFAKCLEACGRIVSNFPAKRAYYGMASEEGQKDLFGKVIRPSEGIKTHVIVDTNLKQLETEFEAALRSAMSYTGCKTLSEFRNNVKWEYQTISEFNNYYK